MKKYTTIMISQDLKDKMLQRIIDLRQKLTYPQLIELLLKQTENDDTISRDN